MSYDYFKTPDPEEPKEVAWGDYPKAAGATVAGIGAGSAGLMRQMFEAGNNPEVAQIFRGLQTASRNLGEDIEGSMTEEGRARNAAGVTTAKFLEHPVSSLALKAVGMSPYLVAAAVPGALIGEGIAGMAATGVAAGWLAAGDVADEITKKPDKMSDEELRKTSQLYADFRNQGQEEREARTNLNQIMVGAKPAIAFILGAGTGVLGPAGNIARGLGRKAVGEAAEAAPAFMGRHGVKAAALEGGATEFAEEGYGGIAAQQSEIQAGMRKDYDASEILDRALTGMALGTGFGAVSGIGAGRGKGKEKADEIRAAKEQRGGEEGTGVQIEAGQGEVAVPAKGATTAGTTQGTIGVSADVEAALKAEQPPTPKPKVDEVAPPAPPPAAQPNVPPAPSPVAQPQQPPPVVPPGEAAAVPPVTSGVTPSAPGPVLTEKMLVDLERRGVLRSEAPNLTREQIADIMNTPAGGPPAGMAGMAAQKPDTQATTQGVTTPATPDTSGVDSNVAASQTEQAATPPKGTATSKKEPGQPGQAGPTAAAEGETAPKKSKKGATVINAKAEVAARSKAAFEKHSAPDAEKLDERMETPEKRKAVALRLKNMLAEFGIERREDMPDHLKKYHNTTKSGIKLQEGESERWHKSLQGRVGAAVVDPHVRFMREMVAVQKMLEKGKDLGPKSKNLQRARVFAASLNNKSLDLTTMSRKEGGAEFGMNRKGGSAEQVDEMGGPKVVVQQKGSENLPGSKVRQLSPEEFKKQADAALAAANKKPVGAEPSATEQVAAPSEISDEVAVSAETKPAKPEGAGKAKAKEIKDKGRVEASPELFQTADKFLAALNNLPPTKNPVQKARRAQAIKDFNEQTSAALKSGDWSAVVKTMADLNVKVPKAKAQPKPKAEPAQTVHKELETSVERAQRKGQEAQDARAEQAAEEERIKKEDAERPRKVWPMVDTSMEGMHEGAREAHIELNKIKTWINGLSEADYRRLPDEPHKQMQDTNTLKGVQHIAKWFEETMGVNPLVAKEQQGEITPKVTEEKPPKAEAAAAAKPATPPAEVSVTPAKPKDTRKVDMETRGILKGLGYTELDIKNMSYERANARADLGTQKKEGVTQRVTKRSAIQAKLAALTPEQRASLEALRGKMAKGGEEVSQKQIQKAGKQVEADMTAAEFSALSPEEFWRALQAKVRGEIFLYSHEFNKWPTTAHKAQAIYGHAPGSITAPIDTNTVLKDYVHLGHLVELPKAVQDFVRKRLAEVLDRVPVYVMTREVFDDTLGSKRASGFFDDSPNKSGPHGYIAIPDDVAANSEHFASTMIHEALHAALHNKINTDPKFSRQIKILMNELDYRTKNNPARKFLNYSLTNEHEFISELGSNETLQMVMSEMHLRPEISESLGLPPTKPISLWGAFISKVRQTFGLAPVKGMDNFLDSALRVLTPQMEAVQREAGLEGHYQAYKSEGVRRARMTTDELLEKAAAGIGDGKINLTGSKARGLDRVSTLHQLVQRGKEFFGPSNPLNQLFDIRARMERAKDVILDKYGGLRATIDIAKAERKYPELMAKIKEVVFSASRHDINLDGDNGHLGKDKMMGVQAKGEIAALKAAWNDPALDAVRDTVRQAATFFKDIHNAVSRATIKNILAEANIHDEALVDRIHRDGLTEEDEKAWAGTKLMSALEAVRALKRREGTFIPFRRYGDFISAAEHELSVPKNATKINDNTVQFVAPNEKNMAARAMAKSYLRSNSHTPQGNQLNPVQVKKVWVDKNDHSKLVEKEDVDAIPAYRVSMQIEHVEMHRTEAEAKNNQDALKKSGLLNPRSHKREDAYDANVGNLQSAMGTVLRSLEKQQRYIDADSTQKAAMREMFHDLTLGLSGNTSIKNSMRQRRNVAGESHDLGRVTADYARMTANHLAKLEHQPQMAAQFKTMREYMDAHVNDKDNIRRKEIYDEFINRLYGKAAMAADVHKGGIGTRIIQMTRLSFLAGPSFHIINSHEPWTTSLPILGGRHGFVAAMRAMKDTYSAIGGRTALMEGFKDTAKALTNDSGFTDYVKLFKDTIGKSQFASADKTKRNQDMIDYMNDRNLYSNSSIFEAAKFANPNAQGVLGYAGRTLDRADLMANQVGSAIEAINRTVTGLTAYNLEYKKNGGNHEAAMHYAYTTAHQTMGDYSSWNAAPVFNTKYGKGLLQFKKFPQKTYALLGNVMGGVIKGDPQAMKQFAGLMVTHGLVAGALGMPTEPFKIALAAANVFGLTGFTPEDYDYAVRKMMADLLGKKGGEIASRGIYRGIGIELSGRMGLDSLLLRSLPKSQKEADVKSFLFDTLAGASASYLWNQVEGAKAALKGDWATALEKMSPLRTVGDVTKAVEGYYGDKKNAAGKTIQEQFNAWEALVRTLGFTPSRAAEFGANRGTQARESKALNAERAAIIKARIDATGSKMLAAQRAMQEFNRTHAVDEQITSKDITNAVKKRMRDETNTSHGVIASKRTRDIQERAESVFNF